MPIEQPHKNIVAYAKMGKNNKKSKKEFRQFQPTEESTSDHIHNRKSGELYGVIFDQLDPNQSQYLQSLVNKRQAETKKEKKNQQPKENHERTKSYANICIENMTTKNEESNLNGKDSRFLRPTKETDFKYFSHQATPKNGSQQRDPRLSYKREESFLESLDCYLDVLNRSDQQSAMVEPFQLEIRASRASQQQQLKMLRQLEQSNKKTKQLKMQNEMLKRDQKNKDKQMKLCFNEILAQLKKTNNQLTFERRERKRLEKVLNDVEESIRKNKPERKTIGHSGKKINKFDHYINFEMTEGDSDRNEMEMTAHLAQKYHMKSNSNSKMDSSYLKTRKHNRYDEDSRFNHLFKESNSDSAST